METTSSTRTAFLVFAAALAAVTPTVRALSAAPRRAAPPAQAGKKPEEQNLCIKGRLVPELYVLGVHKAATCNLYNNLHCQGVQHPKAMNYMSEKEYPWWPRVNRLYRYTHSDMNASSIKETASHWLNDMPACDSEQRKVVADMNPYNFGLVKQQQQQTDSNAGQVGGLPGLLSEVYGAQRKRLTFVVMLREPLSRMQSAWYMQRKSNSEPFHAQGASTFAQGLELAYQASSSSAGVLHPWLQEGLYSTRLPAWFKAFAESQFVFIPVGHFAKDPSGVCTELESRLTLGMNCNRFNANCFVAERLGQAEAAKMTEVEQASYAKTITFDGSNEHPALEEDAGAEMLKKYVEFLAPYKRELIRQLEGARKAGATLAGIRDGESVGAWLDATW
eukprot:TRINITY_DN46706_c0_g1_i1.p1 TRINITY_DN46706_c0_g1~~TRINITY_DN46706_c0_g1_i1.p1  ORF type:complete len:390 (+),score=81.82 TRINITY_DN46706_c0_g1_i1:60-1229(+)